MPDANDFASTGPTSPPLIGNPRAGRLDRIFLALLALALTLFRLHAWDAPLEADECNYAFISARLAEGQRLYVDVWDHQPPGIFTLLTGAILLFGDEPYVYRALACVSAIGTLLLVYLIATVLMGRQAAWMASTVYALSSSDPGVAGEGCNREIYMNLLATGAVALLLLSHRRPGESLGSVRLPSVWAVFASGVLLALASSMKTIMAAPWLALMIWLVWNGIKHRSADKSRGWKYAIAFSAGPFLLWCLVGLYFAATNRSDALIEAVFQANVAYSGLNHNFFERFVYAFRHWSNWRTNAPLWLAAAAGFVLMIWKDRRGEHWALLAATVGTVFAIALPEKPFSHYFQLLVPWACLLTGRVVVRTSRSDERAPAGPGVYRSIAALILTLIFIWQVAWYLAVPADQVSMIRYDGRDRWARDQGLRVATLTDPQDSLFIWGNDPGIYYYSDRRCASRFTMINSLRGETIDDVRRRSILLDELHRRRPRLFLVTLAPIPPELAQFLRDHYQRVGQDPKHMDVWCDPARPIAAVDWTWRPNSHEGK